MAGKAPPAPHAAANALADPGPYLAPLPVHVEAKYSAFIDDILRLSDINTISAKRIRKALQERVDSDLSEQKVRRARPAPRSHADALAQEQITALILQRFDKFNAEQNGSLEPPEPSEPIPSVENGAQVSNGTPLVGSTHKRSPDDDSALSEVEDAPPTKKKAKKSKPVAEADDAAFAARLQAEENARTRPTRGGNAKRRVAVPKKKAEKKTKTKSSTRVKDEDDSDVNTNSDADKKSQSRKGGFHVGRSRTNPTACSQSANHSMQQKPMALSPALSELLGETQLSRPQTVKKIWQYVKERDLQDPADKRQIRCDDAMRAVFKQDRVHMFTMNKILNQNLYALEETV